MTNSFPTTDLGAFGFDPDSKELRDEKDQTVSLRPQTAQVLGILVSRRGELVSKQDLMAEVWGDTHVTDDSLVQCISEIRKTLGPSDGKLIKTVTGKGYLLLRPSHGPRSNREIRPDAPNRAFQITAGSFVLLAVAVAAVVAVSPLVSPGHQPNISTGTILPIAEIAPKLVVLPFENIGLEEAYVYLPDGVTDDLTTALATNPRLTVISRDSAFLYRDPSVPTAEISDQLNATHLVQGTLRNDGSWLRINVRLTRMQDANIVWARTFEGDVGDLFTFEAKIVNAVSSELTGAAQGGSHRTLMVTTSSQQAYRAFQLGRQLFFEFQNRATNERARALFEEALSNDPEFAMAQAMLAFTYSFAAQNGWADDRNLALTTAYKEASRAIELDPGVPLSYFVTGLVHRERGDYVAAMVEAEKALDLDPNYASAQVLKATLLYYAGRPAESVARLERAMLLNPHHPFQYNFHLGQAFFILHRYDDAIKTLTDGLESNPASERLHVWLAASYAKAGLLDDAAWEADQVLLMNPAFSLETIAASYPFKDETDRANFAEALSLAGLI